jgi:3D (Asp-Asp-Asp) domain-containing protein
MNITSRYVGLLGFVSYIFLGAQSENPTMAERPVSNGVPNFTYAQRLVHADESITAPQKLKIASAVTAMKQEPEEERQIGVAPRQRTQSLKGKHGDGTQPSVRLASTNPLGDATALGDFMLTAYSVGPRSTGKLPSAPDYGITYSGTRADVRRTVAVDPKVIPIGTHLYIEGIGERIAEDTGGAIKGRHIDVLLSSDEAAIQFGVKRHVKVYVYRMQKPSASREFLDTSEWQQRKVQTTVSTRRQRP